MARKRRAAVPKKGKAKVPGNKENHEKKRGSRNMKKEAPNPFLAPIFHEHIISHILSYCDDSTLASYDTCRGQECHGELDCLTNPHGPLWFLQLGRIGLNNHLLSNELFHRHHVTSSVKELSIHLPRARKNHPSHPDNNRSKRLACFPLDNLSFHCDSPMMCLSLPGVVASLLDFVRTKRLDFILSPCQSSPSEKYPWFHGHSYIIPLTMAGLIEYDHPRVQIGKDIEEIVWMMTINDGSSAEHEISKLCWSFKFDMRRVKNKSRLVTMISGPATLWIGSEVILCRTLQELRTAWPRDIEMIVDLGALYDEIAQNEGCSMWKGSLRSREGLKQMVAEAYRNARGEAHAAAAMKKMTII
ncbi:hypothetical protein M231_05228 [Tremella mesenterica]|uniref:Uncharacterized protein n=1 Tax=Tremella mesenterica TaxID=5217 RepID=A0A4V1M3N7_TREME|nr:hypothetical protein M231_05228 [Tremella mesenterica]